MTGLSASRAADEAPADGESALAGDARRLQSALERNLQSVQALVDDLGAADVAQHTVPEVSVTSPARPSVTPARKWLSPARWGKLALGAALVAGLGWSPLKSMLAATSAEAVVNARIVAIRSPIEGTIAAAPDARGSWTVENGAPLLRIVDPQADRARLDDLRRQYGALDDQAQSLASRSAQIANALAPISAQVETFRRRRVEQLNVRMKALEAEVATAAARSAQAAGARQRTDALRRTGVASVADSEKAQSESIAAANAEQVAMRRLEELSIERDAAIDGVFVGDNINDTTSSAQRADELRLRFGELDAQAIATQSQMKRLADEIAAEGTRFRARSDVAAALPASGRVWEMLVAPGEHVAKGQELMRVLDCASPTVSANVDENVYDRLELGGSATFKPALGGGTLYQGTIVNLTGEASAPANFAISPTIMRTSSFYVTVAIAGMGEAGCSVGRTGTVTFAPAGAGAGAPSSIPELRR